MSHILKNAVQCKHCGDTIESTHRHDFQRCTCGAVFVDGGLDYLRRGFKTSPDVDYEELSVVRDAHANDSHLLLSQKQSSMRVE
jgi:hypothetical protein